MSSTVLGSPYRTICQIVDRDGKPYQATGTSDLWVEEHGVFSPTSEGNAVVPFTTGADYFKDFIARCAKAKSEICIIGWQVNWDAQLNDQGLRLYDVLLEAVRVRNVNVYVLPWRHANPVQTYDYQTEIVLDEINNTLKLGGKKRVHVASAASQASVNASYYSHHQKQVIIDREIAYIGGIDLAYGRFDDARFELRADSDGRKVMNRYNPCIPWRKALAYDSTLADPDLMRGWADRLANLELNQKKIDQGAWQVPYEEASTADAILNKPSVDSNTPDLFTLDPARQPRMPWQDVHCRIKGPAVSHLLHNFVVRWNSCGGKKLPLPKPPKEYAKRGQAHIQVLRSAPAGMVGAEAAATPLAARNAHGERKPLAAEAHIQQAMLQLIEKASRFIYIEGQFFVSAFGAQFPSPSPDLSPAAQFINNYGGGDQNATAKKIGWVDDNGKKELMAPPANGVCQALVKRVTRAILDASHPHFHVYITLPVHPEGQLAKASIAAQVYWTMQSLAHGSHSLLNGIRRALKAKDFLDQKIADDQCEALAMADKLPLDQLDPEDERWKDYVTLLNLRNWTKLGERYVTEQIYVHTKLIIVDDLYAMLGSANINDRSLLGERDSEIAVLVMDGETSRADINGKGSQRPVRQFAHQLRKDIWKKLFGVTGGIRPASDLASAIEAPGIPDSWRRIQKQADKNAAAYEAAFPFVPRSWSGEVDADGRLISGRILPTWKSSLVPPPQATWKKGNLGSPMPFQPEFWDAPQHDPKGVAQLEKIRGFITALPVHWLRGENVRFKYPTGLLVENEHPQSLPAPQTKIAKADKVKPESKA